MFVKNPQLLQEGAALPGRGPPAVRHRSRRGHRRVPRAADRHLLLEFADVPSIKASNAKVTVAEITTMFPIVLRTRPYDEQRPLKPPFTEKKVRQAIQAAIKQEEFIEIVRSGWGIDHDGPHPHLPEAVGAARVGAAGVRSQEGQAPAHRGRLRERLRDRADRRQPRRQREERPGGEGPARQGGHPGQPEADGDGPVLQQELLVRLLDERAHRAHRRGARGGHPPVLRRHRHVLPVGQQGDPPPDRRAGQDPRSEEARGDGPPDPADAAGRRARTCSSTPRSRTTASSPG